MRYWENLIGVAKIDSNGAGSRTHSRGRRPLRIQVLVSTPDVGVQVPPRAPKQGNPQSQRIAGFSLFFNASRAFWYYKILKRISRKRKQKQNFVSKFACSFACCLLAMKSRSDFSGRLFLSLP